MPLKVGLGDPTPLGLGVAVLYAVAAALCVGARHLVDVSERSERRAWLVIAVLCLALGINKQLDVQTFLIRAAGDCLRAVHLQALKRWVQLAVIAALCLGCLALAGLLVLWGRASNDGARVAAFGLAILFAYVLLRAGRFLRIFDDRVFGSLGEAAVEVVGLLIVVAGGLRRRWGPRSSW